MTKMFMYQEKIGGGGTNSSWYPLTIKKGGEI